MEPVAKWWIDTIKFERVFGKPHQVSAIILRAIISLKVPSEIFNTFIRESESQNYHESFGMIDADPEHPEVLWEHRFAYPFLCKTVPSGAEGPSAPFDFGFPKPSSWRTIDQTYFPDVFAVPPKLCLKENSAYLIPTKQNFSLPHGFIKYIATAYTSFLATHKLYQSCKYFFHIRKEFLCDNLSFYSGGTIWKSENLTLSTGTHEPFYLNILKNLWLHGNLLLMSLKTTDLQTLCSKITYFNYHTIKIASLPEFMIPLSDLQILSNSSNLISFDNMGAGYVHPDDTMATLSEVLDSLPTVTTFM